MVYRWGTFQRKSLCIYFDDRALVSLEEVRNTGELRCTNVDDGKLEWGSFLERSE